MPTALDRLNAGEPVLMVIAIAVICAVMYGVHRLYGGWQVRRWCRNNDFILLDWRGAWFFEGPGAWFRSDNQDAYYIEVEDNQGMIRGGYLIFGSFWWPWPINPDVRVRWE